MTEKGEEMGETREERERESVLSFGIWIYGGGGEEGGERYIYIYIWGGYDRGKGTLPVPNIPRDEWENRSILGRKTTTLVGCSENPMILISLSMS